MREECGKRNAKKIPEIVDFRDTDGNDTCATHACAAQSAREVRSTMNEQIQLNYERIKREVRQIVDDEMERIKKDPDLQHLVKNSG